MSARMAVFRGGFQWEAAQEIVAADKTVLANLVEHFYCGKGPMIVLNFMNSYANSL